MRAGALGRAGVPLLVTAAALYVGFGLWRLAAGDADAAFGPASVFSTADDGLSQAYDYLVARRGAGRVGVLERRIHAGEVPDDAVVFQVWNGQPWLAGEMQRIQEELREEADDAGNDADDTDAEDAEESGNEAPEEPTAAAERPAATPFVSPREAQWVRRGGRLVVATDEGFSSLEIAPAERNAAPRKVFPVWPAVARLAPPAPRVLGGAGIAGTHAVFAIGERPLLVRLPLGAGEVFLLATPEVFANANLGEADHLGLLEALAGDDRPVYFDETVRGVDQGAGLLHLLRRWRLVPALALLVAAALAAGWRRGRRLGPPEDPYRERRSEAVDMVDSLAHLYARSLRRRDMLALYRREVGDAVARRTGLRGAELAARLESLAGPPPDGDGELDAGTFRRHLQTLNDVLRRTEHDDRFRSRHRVA